MILFGSIIVLVAMATLHLWSQSQFQKRADQAIEKLSVGFASNTVDINSVPRLVRDFAERAIAQEQNKRAKIIHIRQRGEIRMKPNAGWQPLTANQYFSVFEPGFLWMAKVKVAPFVDLVVVDSYVNKEGFLTARLLGSIPLASASGVELDQGELMRYIAELVWNPSAFIKNTQLQYTTIDDNAVSVSIGDASVDLIFDEHGDIVRIYAPDRPRTVGKESIPTPWEGKFFDYTQIGPYRIPKRGEVAWLLDEDTFTYWRGEILDVEVKT